MLCLHNRRAKANKKQTFQMLDKEQDEGGKRQRCLGTYRSIGTESEERHNGLD
jgi:hypothetical protein